MNACNENILKVIENAENMLFLADKGDLQREDPGCGVLFGIVRDSAYKLRELARQEKQNHIRQGTWDGSP